MIQIDAHCHFWKLSRGDYDWLDTGNPALAPIARDFQPEDMAAHRSAARVNKVIVIQAAASEAETDYLLDLADRHDEIGGVVGWADLNSGNFAHCLEEWSGNPKFKGIRPMLQDIENTNWIIEQPQATVGSVLSNAGLRFDALIQPRHLPVIYQFCKDNPDLAIVIDHAAKPKSALAGDSDAFLFWSQHMEMLASDTGAYCKLSGLLTEIDADGPADRIADEATDLGATLSPYVDVLLDTFGPERLMWGSDWPVLTLVSDYQSWRELSQALLKQLNPSQMNQIFGGTAATFYNVENAQ